MKGAKEGVQREEHSVQGRSFQSPRRKAAQQRGWAVLTHPDKLRKARALGTRTWLLGLENKGWGWARTPDQGGFESRGAGSR